MGVITAPVHEQWEEPLNKLSRPSCGPDIDHTIHVAELNGQEGRRIVEAM